MKKTVRILAAAVISALCASSVKAAITTATWGNWTGGPSYNGTIAGGTLITGTPTLGVASTGGGTISAVANGGPNGTGDSFVQIAGKGTQVNGSTLQFTITPNGALYLSTLTFNYDQIGGTGASGINWTITAGGTGTISSSSLTTGTGNGWLTASSVNLTGITLTSGNITILGTLTGGSGSSSGSGDIGFDNFVVTAVPEPITYALAAFGLVFVGAGVGRYYMGRRQPGTVS